MMEAGGSGGHDFSVGSEGQRGHPGTEGTAQGLTGREETMAQGEAL